MDMYRFNAAFPTDTTTAAGIEIPLPAYRIHIERWIEFCADHVAQFFCFDIFAPLDGNQFVGRTDDRFRDQKTQGQLFIVTWRAQRYALAYFLPIEQRTMAEPYLQRFFGDHQIICPFDRPVIDPIDMNGGDRCFHIPARLQQATK